MAIPPTSGHPLDLGPVHGTVHRADELGDGERSGVSGDEADVGIQAVPAEGTAAGRMDADGVQE